MLPQEGCNIAPQCCPIRRQPRLHLPLLQIQPHNQYYLCTKTFAQFDLEVHLSCTNMPDSASKTEAIYFPAHSKPIEETDEELTLKDARNTCHSWK